MKVASYSRPGGDRCHHGWVTARPGRRPSGAGTVGGQLGAIWCPPEAGRIMMRPLWRNSGSLAGAVALMASGAPASSGAGAGAEAPPPGGVPEAAVPELSWQECPELPELRCAEASVPLDYAEPDGPTITLALVRRPAEDRGQRLGTLVVNRGGPGYSARDYLAGITEGQLPSPVSDDVLARFDLVGVDTRGSGHSHPTVTCFESQQAAAQFAAEVPILPVTAAQQRERADADRAYADGCREHSGELLDHLHSVAMARDLDLVRAALDEPHIHYFGQSYGSYLGALYADMFPQRVGRFVFDSVLDPAGRDGGEPGSTPSGRLRTDEATAQTLAEFFALCRDAGERCGFGGSDPAAAFADLTDTLAAAPVQLTTPDGEPVELTYEFVIAWTGQWLYQPVLWEEHGGAAFLRAVEAALADPAGPAAAELAAEILAFAEAGLVAAPTPTRTRSTTQ